MKIRRRFTNLCCLVLLAMGSAPAFGQDSVSYDTVIYQGGEALLFTPWPVFEKTLSSYAGPQKNFHRDLGDTTWTIDQYHWTLNGISVDGSSTFTTTQSPNHLNFQSKASQIAVRVQQIGIHQYVDQVVDGVLIHVWVDAQCGPLSLTQTAARMQGVISYQFNQQNISTGLDSFSLQWPANSWSVAPITCTGPTGLPALLSQMLQQNLQSASIAQPWVQQAFAQEIQNEVATLVGQLKVPSALPVPKGSLPLQITFSGFESDSQGVRTHGIIVWDASVSNPKIRPLNLTNLPSGVSQTQSSILLSQASVADLILAETKNLPDATTVDMNSQPDFEALLKSCFEKLFVWPDLLNYSAQSPFVLAFGRPKISDSRWLNNGSLALDFTEVAALQSVRAGKWWNYLYFSGPATGAVSSTIKNGRLTLSGQTEAGKFSMQFGPDYVAAFHPNTYISSQVTDQLYQQLNRHFAYHFSLPNFDLGAGGIATASSWKTLSGGLIEIPLKIQ